MGEIKTTTTLKIVQNVSYNFIEIKDFDGLYSVCEQFLTFKDHSSALQYLEGRLAELRSKGETVNVQQEA